MRDEINADAFGADEAHDLFDGGHQIFRRAVEQEMRFVEEIDELRLVGVADLGKRFEELR